MPKVGVSSQLRQRLTPWRMHIVVLMLVPGSLAMVWYYGIGMLWNILWLVACCGLVEWLCLKMASGAGHPSAGLADGTTLLAAWIMALCLPPFVSPGILLIGALSAIGLTKYAYGGVGHNVFNPAMVGYSVMLLSFPEDLAMWPDLTPMNTDGLSGATLLSEFRYRGEVTVAEFFAGRPDTSPETVIASLFFLGGLTLIGLGIMHWRIPLALLATVAVLAAITFDQGSSNSLGSPWFHWMSGGTMMAAFFVATDPVTHPARPSHQIFFAVLLGCLLMLIRTQGSLPDGIAFAVLLANCTTPFFNRLHRARLASDA